MFRTQKQRPPTIQQPMISPSILLQCPLLNVFFVFIDIVWPGELGIMSNYALVYAKLLFNGKNKGVHPFMVQIRDFKTHKPLPGIIVGDIGPKQGYSIKDNGFLAFQNYRVPLFSLLGRYVRIENGQFSRHGNEKVFIIYNLRYPMPR